MNLRKGNVYALSAMLLSVLGSCASSSSSSDDSPPQVRAKPVVVADAGSTHPKATHTKAANAKGAPMKKADLSFQIGTIDSDKLGVEDVYCVRLTADGECFPKAEFQAALPADIVKRTQEDPALLLRFIDALHWLEGVSVHTKEIVSNRANTDKQIALWVGSEAVLRRDMWRASRSVLAPATNELRPPTWKGQTLSWTRLSKKLDWATKQTTIAASEHQVDFDAPLAIATGKPIKSEAVDLTAERERVYKVFGGKVGGFFTIEITDTSKLMVAMGPDKGSSRFVLTTQGSANRGLALWKEVAALLPKDSNSQVLARLLTGLSRFLGGSSYSTIEDAAAYKKQYKEEGWHTRNLAYWVDQRAVFEYSIPEFDSISEPTVTDGKLVLFFLPPNSQGGGREPHRLDIDLHSLGQSLVLSGTAMATSEVVSDTGGHFTDTQRVRGPDVVTPDRVRRLRRK